MWKDIISGDEMISDSYTMKLVFEDAALEVKSRLVTKKANEDFGVSNNSKSLSPICRHSQSSFND